jgi:hypothetical protein
MPHNLEYNQPVGNGKDASAGSEIGLGNTSPVDTLGSTLGVDAPFAASGAAAGGLFQRRRGFGFVTPVPAVGLVVVVGEPIPITQDDVIHVERVEVKVLAREAKARALKPSGQIVLFQRIMEDWGFGEPEAATLLGFETASDISEIYHGRRSVGHRDANDRLRAVLRMGADLDALFGEVAAIREWLSEAQRDLGGMTPRSLLTEGSMENLLKVKQYIAFLSGR